MSDFDIRKAVHAVMAETDLTSPEEIAAKVAEDVPAKALRAVLARVLRTYVRIELGISRMPTMHVPDPANPVSSPNIRTPGSARSAKVRAIREAAPGWLRDRVYIGNHIWKMIGDCTYENLRYLESERVDNAERSRAAAARYGRLADLVKKHKAARVADLPAHVLIAGEEAAA